MELNHRIIATPNGGIKKYLTEKENENLMKEWEKEEEISTNESLLRKKDQETREMFIDKISLMMGMPKEIISKIL